MPLALTSYLQVDGSRNTFAVYTQDIQLSAWAYHKHIHYSTVEKLQLIHYPTDIHVVASYKYLPENVNVVQANHECFMTFNTNLQGTCNLKYYTYIMSTLIFKDLQIW